MIGAIAGDIIGSVYEVFNTKKKDFKLFSFRSGFTDDTVLTIAVADAILNSKDYSSSIKKWAWRHPLAGYGGKFSLWFLLNKTGPYNSWGNGSAMRVSPVGFAFDNLEKVLEEAKKSAEVTHNHPEGIKGAQAVASAIFLSRTGKSKAEIKKYIEEEFKYNLDRTLLEIRPGYKFDVSCQGSVPEAIISFLESSDYEDAIRNAVSLGGDSDTIACITGGIAQAFYKGAPPAIIEKARAKLTKKMIKILDEFNKKYKL
ncbi:MAG: ADP-ribosylglycohydrolase family protein [Elusimicrobiales bacterium]|nr:ADP-ribosylglycohydrolase family protein [Elusimicrobiales bacterium]